ncbi:MAG: hypothetical protein ACTSW1_19135 [Candidatus Hodarchaeales archaeon]
MMQDFIQDPDNLEFENLFFFLSMGKFDEHIEHITHKDPFEEFLIVREIYKPNLAYIRTAISMLVEQQLKNKELKCLNPNHTKIQFVIYFTPITNHFLGLGVRFLNPVYDYFGRTNVSIEHRLERAMYLLSRGLLNSRYHSIEQIICQIQI